MTTDPHDPTGPHEHEATEHAEVLAWLRDSAHPLTSLSPDSDPNDLTPLRTGVGDATVVGLGGSSRLTHELSTTKHKVLRFLVEEMGFRVLALELPGSVGQALDHYVRTGDGDPEAILTRAQPFWHFTEVADVVRWMRARAATHPDDPVSVIGADSEPDAPGEGPVADRVRRAAPELAARPETLAFAEHYLAEGVTAGHEQTGAKVVYWGGVGHVAVGDRRIASAPPGPPLIDRNAGSYLRERFGPGYVTVGLTFDSGNASVPVPPAPPELMESVLARVGPDAFLLDLRGRPDENRPLAVERWLAAPARARLIGPRYDPARDADHHLTGASPAEWFDALVYIREVTPAQPLTPR